MEGVGDLMRCGVFEEGKFRRELEGGWTVGGGWEGRGRVMLHG